MRTYKWLFIGGSIMLFASLSLFFDSPNRVSATSGPNCDAVKCTFIDTTINDFQVGQFIYTGLNNATGDGSVQLLPVGLTSPWITDTYNIGTPRTELAAVAYNGNGTDYIYVIGGLDNSSPRQVLTSILKATANSNGSIAAPGFTVVSNLPLGRSGHAAVISPTTTGAWLYVLGGNTKDTFGNEFITSTIYYNFIDTNGNFPEPSNWRTATMPLYGYAGEEGRLVYYQAVVNNGYLYVMGGADAYGNPYDHIWRAAINGATGALGSWEGPETNLPSIPRKSFAATTWQGPAGSFLYLLGGLQANDYNAQAAVDYAPFDSSGHLNPFSTSGAALPTGYYAHGAVQSNNVLYVTAGNPGGSDTNITTTVQSALIDQDTGSLRNIITGTANAWITSNPLPQGRKYHATVIGSNNGEVYVIGGYGPDGNGTNTVYHGSTRGFGANYAPAGTYTSKIINMVSQRNVNKLVVNTTITNPVTMTVQYRIGDSDGEVTGAPWINLPSLTPGVNVSHTFTVNFTKSKIQYRALLTTTVSNLSPALNAFEVQFPAPPTPTPTATATNTPGAPQLPDFTIYGIEAPPANSAPISQTFKIRVANIGNRAFAPVQRAPGTPVAQLAAPLFRAKTAGTNQQTAAPRRPSATQYFAWIFFYIDPSPPPTKLTDMPNCRDQSGNLVIPPFVFVGDLPVGFIKDYQTTCWINTTGTHNFYALVNGCDNPSDTPDYATTCSPTQGYVIESRYDNNIFGPVPSGATLPPLGANFLPYIQKSP